VQQDKRGTVPYKAIFALAPAPAPAPVAAPFALLLMLAVQLGRLLAMQPRFSYDYCLAA
jgi:hypothetical protein